MWMLLMLGCPAPSDDGPTDLSSESAPSATDTEVGRRTGELTLDEADGVVVGRAGDEAGFDLCGADLDGDGRAEVVVGAREGNAVWVVSGLPGEVSTTDADARLVGSGEDWFGFSVSAPGDVDGDGREDLLVGAPLASDSAPRAGAAYLFLGPLTGELTPADAAVVLDGGAQNDQLGTEVAGAGDVDGDGTVDWLASAWLDDSVALDAGSVLLMDGSARGALAPAESTATLRGIAAEDWVGYSAAGVGDLDGDGFGDLLIGADGVDLGGASAGAAYLWRGPVTGTRAIDQGQATLRGTTPAGFSGHAVSAAGDADADGRPDFIVGAFGENHAGLRSGSAYVVLGVPTGTVDLPDAAEIRGDGLQPGDFAGYTVGPAGDVDGDGFDDVLIGSRYAAVSGFESGSAHLLYGPLEAGSVDLASGLTVHAEARGDEASYGLSPAGDVDGDGRPDWLVGSPFADLDGDASGAVYLLLGG